MVRGFENPRRLVNIHQPSSVIVTGHQENKCGGWFSSRSRIRTALAVRTRTSVFANEQAAFARRPLARLRITQSNEVAMEAAFGIAHAFPSNVEVCSALPHQRRNWSTCL